MARYLGTAHIAEVFLALKKIQKSVRKTYVLCVFIKWIDDELGFVKTERIRQ